MPVNPLDYQGAWYLFSPRGDSEWVRNLRVSGEGTLTKGRHVRRFRVEQELADAEKPPVIRAYMQKWGKQISSIVGFGPDASDAVLAEVAPKHPVFRIEMIPGQQ